MGFSNVGAYVDAYEAGKRFYSTWRKTPSQTTVAGQWTDLSMSPGNPSSNVYASAPLDAAVLSYKKGIQHGGNVSPSTKHLKKIMAMTATSTAVPLDMILCDYVMYYPFFDMSLTDPQTMTNYVDDVTVAALPRYTDGKGLQIIAVEVGAQSGGQSFYVTYTNQDGTPGRVSQTVTCNANASTGTLIQTAPGTLGSMGPFIPLQAGDSGVRSIESATMLGADIGFITFVLVKPLATHAILSTTAAAERDFLIDFPSLPTIIDGAYLNFIVCPNGTLSAAPIHGEIEVIWS